MPPLNNFQRVVHFLDNVIKQLIEIDAYARSIMQELEKDKIEEKKKIDKEVVEYKNSYMDRAKIQIEKVRDFELEQSKEQYQKISAKNKSIRDHLINTYNENHEKWENEIFNRIVGR